jgi:hypothetical protein
MFIDTRSVGSGGFRSVGAPFLGVEGGDIKGMNNADDARGREEFTDGDGGKAAGSFELCGNVFEGGEIDMGFGGSSKNREIGKQSAGEFESVFKVSLKLLMELEGAEKGTSEKDDGEGGKKSEGSGRGKKCCRSHGGNGAEGNGGSKPTKDRERIRGVIERTEWMLRFNSSGEEEEG